MVSEDKIAVFLKLQQTVLDIKDSTNLLNLFLPEVLRQLLSVGIEYEFLSAIFLDANHKVQQQYLVEGLTLDISKKEIIDIAGLLQKGSSWEMELFYGRSIIVSDIKKIVYGSYPQIANISSLLLFPIQNLHKLSGILILANSKTSKEVKDEEIEFITMINRLIDLAFRLQDTENSLTQITQQVYQTNAKLHQLDKLKDDFVSIASHELRTPMTAIRSYVWMALHKSDIPLSQKLERYLYRTLVSTERLISLVNDMLNVSRIESGKIEINPQSFDIVSLVKEVMEEVLVKAGEKKLQLIVLEHKLPLMFADPDKVHQILLNLIGNSLKFSYPGGIITVDFQVNGGMIEVSIKDTGSGILKEDQTKLFHKFSRLDNSYTALSTSSGSGTGLGLYISKSLTDLMKGTIEVQSEGEDKGCIFTITLPVASKEVLANADKFKITPENDIKPLEPVAI